MFGNNFFFVVGKDYCPACTLAKNLLLENNANFHYEELTDEKFVLFETLVTLVKDMCGEVVPPTIPQIFMLEIDHGKPDNLESLIELFKENKVKFLGGFNKLATMADEAVSLSDCKSDEKASGCSVDNKRNNDKQNNVVVDTKD